MQAKSKIQLIREAIECKQHMQAILEDIMEGYNIVDNFFVWNRNQVMEASRGYFQMNGEYDDLGDAMHDMDLSNQCIRIIGDEKYQVGTIKANLSECDSNKQIFDIEKSTYTHK